MGGRFAFLAACFLGAYVFLLFHLYQIQVAKNPYYSAKAESQYAALYEDASRRGTIYFTDRDGNKLPAAQSRDFPVIYAVPKVIQDPLAAATAAAPLIGKKADDLLKDLSKKQSSYVVLDKHPSAATAEKVREAKITGIYTEDVPRRWYPFGSLAAQVLGFVGPNTDDNGDSGKYGLEKRYGGTLAGKGELGTGEDLVLTIDPTIQKEAEHIIAELVDEFDARSASVIVAEPATGRILAMGNAPTFDPNNYSASNVRVFRNPLVEDMYEPGSVFKVLTMAAGIDTGKITPNTVFYDSGKLELNGRTIRNWDLKAHGRVTMTEVIEGSLNTGAAFAERETGHENFRRYVENFGFGKQTGITLPGELPGNLSPIRPGAAEVNYATAAFGQGIVVTPLQVIQAVGSIANGGKLMRPYLDVEMGPEEVRRVMRPETARQVTEMMISAVDKAKIAAIDGYSVAGKTGTAQIPDFVRGGYTEDVIASYVGFAPASDPKFIILIKLDKPYGAPLAGQTVVPAFRELVQFLLNYFHVPPDRIGGASS